MSAYRDGTHGPLNVGLITSSPNLTPNLASGK